MIKDSLPWKIQHLRKRLQNTLFFQTFLGPQDFHDTGKSQSFVCYLQKNNLVTLISTLVVFLHVSISGLHCLLLSKVNGVAVSPAQQLSLHHFHRQDKDFRNLERRLMVGTETASPLD